MLSGGCRCRTDQSQLIIGPASVRIETEDEARLVWSVVVSVWSRVSRSYSAPNSARGLGFACAVSMTSFLEVVVGVIRLSTVLKTKINKVEVSRVVQPLVTENGHVPESAFFALRCSGVFRCLYHNTRTTQ
jgi:hypothetical protein